MKKVVERTVPTTIILAVCCLYTTVTTAQGINGSIDELLEQCFGFSLTVPVSLSDVFSAKRGGWNCVSCDPSEMPFCPLCQRRDFDWVDEEGACTPAPVPLGTVDHSSISMMSNPGRDQMGQFVGPCHAIDKHSRREPGYRSKPPAARYLGRDFCMTEDDHQYCRGVRGYRFADSAPLKPYGSLSGRRGVVRGLVRGFFMASFSTCMAS